MPALHGARLARRDHLIGAHFVGGHKLPEPKLDRPQHLLCWRAALQPRGRRQLAREPHHASKKSVAAEGLLRPPRRIVGARALLAAAGRARVSG